jgi:GAF domain-containing protein
VQRFLRKHQGRRDITLMMNLFAPAGDLSNDPQLYAKRVATALGVPLATQARTIGALVVQSYSGGQRYTARDTELLQFVSTQVAAAIERKQLEARCFHVILPGR